MKAIVIVAGPAGLAAAACLKQASITTRILEKSDCVGSSWRGHYDSLRLHTSRGNSGLPGYPLPASVGRFASRTDVIAYLESYATHHELTPDFGTQVTKIAQDDGCWTVTHSGGHMRADIVVVAAGMNRAPHRPVWPQMDGFAGEISHAASYKRAGPYQGKRVLVVGFGNSGGDIALDLANAGVAVDMSVRGPVNLLPKQLFGIPVTSLGLLGKILPYRVADAVTAPILRLKLGRPSDYGLQNAGKGPMAQVIEDARIPLIDIGTLGAIKAGKINTRPAIEAFRPNGVNFVDGTQGHYDAVICATGYRADLRDILGDVPDVLNAAGKPLASGVPMAATGLYFCSYWVSPNGQLAQAAREAEAIAQFALSQAPIQA